VRKPVTGIPSRDGRQGSGAGQFEGLARPRRPGAQERFHFAPTQFNRRELGGIREERAWCGPLQWRRGFLAL
jgi:hypothetical protein